MRAFLHGGCLRHFGSELRKMVSDLNLTDSDSAAAMQPSPPHPLDEEGGSGALVSAPFVTSGEWTVEAECQYGLFGHSSSDEPPPLLTYYSSA